MLYCVNAMTELYWPLRYPFLALTVTLLLVFLFYFFKCICENFTQKVYFNALINVMFACESNTRTQTTINLSVSTFFLFFFLKKFSSIFDALWVENSTRISWEFFWVDLCRRIYRCFGPQDDIIIFAKL